MAMPEDANAREVIPSIPPVPVPSPDEWAGLDRASVPAEPDSPNLAERGLAGVGDALFGKPAPVKNELSDLFEVPQENDNDIYTDDLVTIDEDDLAVDDEEDMEDLFSLGDLLEGYDGEKPATAG